MLPEIRVRKIRWPYSANLASATLSSGRTSKEDNYAGGNLLYQYCSQAPPPITAAERSIGRYRRPV